MAPSIAPMLPAESMAWITRDQMIAVDRMMIDDLHIELIQMMENAGRHLAWTARALCNPARVVVLAGSGGNGGGGLVAARHLANRGVDVAVVTARPAGDLGPVPAHQLDIVRRLGLPIHASGEANSGQTQGDAEVTGLGATMAGTDLVIDALIGYSLRGAPRGVTAELIERMGSLSVPVLSLDLPSGLDADDGSRPGVAVDATATLTLAQPKTGLRSGPGVGDLYVADISVPPLVNDALELGPPPDFGSGPVVGVMG